MDHQNKVNLERRNFLKSSALLGAGLLTSSRVLAQAGAGKSDDLNVALLGAGAQGQVLQDACIKIPGVRFRAVCDIWKDYNLKRVTNLLAKYKHDVTGYTDYREMLDAEKGKIDAVLIATPDFWHAEHTVACLEAGLHVYCEKEMSNTLEGAKKMVESSRKTGKLLQIGHQRRSNPRYIHCYEKLVKEGSLLGRMTTVNGQWNRAAKPDQGWPEKFGIDDATLNKYGFKNMTQFRNWRWYKGLGGGPIVDLGSHQIDIYNWFLEGRPKAVIASGGTDYYDKATHEWYDTVMAIYEYETKQGVVRAAYQTLTTNSSHGYYEKFMGDQGTLVISESAGWGNIYREPTAPDWAEWVKKGYLMEPKAEEKPKAAEGETDVRETAAPPAYMLPVKMEKKYHQPHLENFFDAVRGKAKLTCPAEIGYETAVTVLKVNEAIEAQKRLSFAAEEFNI